MYMKILQDAMDNLLWFYNGETVWSKLSGKMDFPDIFIFSY